MPRVGLPAPREAASGLAGNGLWGLRFATAHDGYAFGDGLGQTTDGGADWVHAPAPARDIVDLEPVLGRRRLAIGAPAPPPAAGAVAPRRSTDAASRRDRGCG
ncbi:hypothetical protein [Conexibacter sp. DBS9H8]|uniref:hypothetical protein n=1 Tax=Conexibacter sp. DBS9H8 TaxID=2937801 RepID=UPI00200C2989|nr:hypothetical protein [Conexibacter sp. DBS9H8]